MKTKYLGMLTVMAMLSLSACSNKEDLPQEPSAEGLPICFQVSTGDMQSRASHTDANTIDKFGLSIKGEGYKRDPIFFEKRVSQDKQIWTPTSNVAWLNNSPIVEEMIAYYPHDTFGTQYNPYSYRMTFNLEENQTAGSYKSDVMAAHVKNFDPSTVTAENPMVNLQFKHVMSQLQVVLTVPEETTPEVNSITIDGTNRHCNVELNNNDAACYPENRGPVITNQSVQNGNTVTFKCILIPQIVPAGELTVSFVFNEKYYEWVSNKDITLEQNTIHTLNLKVNNATAAQAQSMQSRSWGGHTAYEVISNSMN